MKIVKRILKILFWITLTIIAFYSVFMISQKLIWKDKTPNLLGYKNFIELTGSMEPTLNVGDIIITKETKEIKENDIISFREKNSVITHRVFEIYKENGKEYYITKGDANSDTDSELLDKENIEGKYCFKIPFIGKIILFFQKPVGLIILFAIFLTTLIISSIEPKKKETKK